jgi:hypothetical protein
MSSPTKGALAAIFGALEERRDGGTTPLLELADAYGRLISTLDERREALQWLIREVSTCSTSCS